MTADRRKPGPQVGHLRRKKDFIRLVERLFARKFSAAQIGMALGYSEQRIRQVIVAQRLEPPPLGSFGELMTWLANECPDLEFDVRMFRTEKLTAPEVLKVA